jgi:dTDP-4-dehydrorhamnose 3,5-epimerase
MKQLHTQLPDVRVLEPELHRDASGDFYEHCNEAVYREAGITAALTHAYIRRAAYGMLQGLHYAWPKPQGRLVSVLEGEIYQVAVDIRHGSPDFGQPLGVVLSAENRRQLWIPPGFAHGFCVLSTQATLFYAAPPPTRPKPWAISAGTTRHWRSTGR